ncbi:hypothetical protein [Planotetraspora phitsanulokensis]|uniref:hypothetical protein n=1 Tax=Planotetraspora phitsanulokensis TaxID=575192 RepID=UPI00194E07DD|nr:hypothetical protein [Planotetraspora phitsanulokensis]
MERLGMPTVSIEMRGMVLDGAISEGDLVEIPKGNAGRGFISTDYAYNRTTGSEVRMSKGMSAAWSMMNASQSRVMIMFEIVFAIIVIAGMLVIMGFLAVHFFSFLSGGGAG